MRTAATSDFVFFKINAIVTAVAAAVVLAVAAAAHWGGRLDSLLAWSPAVFSTLGALFVVDEFVTSRSRHIPRSKIELKLLYASIVGLAGFSVLLTGAGIGAAALLGLAMRGYDLALEWVQRGIPSKSLLVALTSVLTALVGGAFFVFRLRLRVLYGATESLAGVAVAAHRVSIEPGTGVPTETGFYFAVLTAGIYLVVRGLDNIHQGLKGDDPVVRKFREWAEKLNQAVER